MFLYLKNKVYRSWTRTGRYAEATSRHSRLLKNPFYGTKFGFGEHWRRSFVVGNQFVAFFSSELFMVVWLLILSDFNQTWWLGGVREWWDSINFHWFSMSRDRFDICVGEWTTYHLIYCARVYYPIFHDVRRPRKTRNNSRIFHHFFGKINKYFKTFMIFLILSRRFLS